MPLQKYLRVFIFTTLILSGCENLLIAQGDIDSLRLVVSNTKDDSIRTLNYIKLSWAYNSVNLDSSIAFAQRANELATKIDNIIYRAASFKELGRCYVYKLQYNIAMHYFEEALAIDEMRGDQVAKSATMMSLANVYRRLNKHKMSLDLDTNGLRVTLQYANDILEQTGKDDTYAPLNVLFFYNNIGVDYLNLGDHNKAQQYFSLFKDYAEEKGLARYLYLYDENMGRLFFESGENPDSAITFNKRMFERSLQNRKFLEAGRIANRLSKIFLDLNNLPESKYYLEQASSLSDSLNSNILLKETYAYYAEYYSKLGNYSLAFEYKNKHISIRDSIFNEENNALIAEYEVMYETVKKEERIALLQKEKEIQRLVNLNQTLVIIAISIVILILIAYFLIRVRLFRKEKIKMREEIMAKDNELASFALYLAKKNDSINKVKTDLEKQKAEFPVENQDLFDSVVNDLNREVVGDSWEEFENRFSVIHPGFFKNLKIKHANLNQNDLKMCSLLRLNLSSKEIASIINITAPSVDVSRSRLRKKLSIPANENLVEYLINY